MLYKPTSRPSKYIFLLCYLLLEKVIENMFWIFKLHVLRNGIVQHKKNLQFLSIHFPENEKKKLFRNDSSFLINLKKAKQILSWESTFSKCLQTYLLACCNVPHFCTKKESVMILKMTNFWWPFFMTSESRFMSLCSVYLLNNK